MILTTNITSATETSTVTPTRVSFPKTVTGPATNNTSVEAVYKLSAYTYKYNKSVVSSPTAAAQIEFDDDKENIQWVLWVDGGLMNGKKDYVLIENKALTNDTAEDFTEETDKIKFIENIKDNAYLQATAEVVVEGGNKINKLTIKFSKWLDGKNVYIEAYRNGPDHNASKGYVKTTAVTAASEILEVYWLNAQGKRITSTGYSAAVTLGIKTLGLVGENLTLSLYDYDSSVTDSDLLQWNGGVNSHVAAITGRHTFVAYNVEAEGAAAYSNAFGDELDSVVEVFVKIESTNTSLQPTLLDQYARIDFTPEQTANVYIASKKKVTVNGTEVDQYNILTSVFPGMKAYIVVETTNLNGAVSFSVTENTSLLVTANTKLPLLEGTTEKTDFTATITNNFAFVEVTFQKIGTTKYIAWNTELDNETGNESEEGRSSTLNIKAQINSVDYNNAEVVKIKSSTIRYILKTTGIIKHHRDVSNKVRYIYKENSGTLHYLALLDFTSINQHGKNYIYVKPKAQLTDVRTITAYSSGNVKFNFAQMNTTSRFYMDIDCLACMLAAMIEVSIEDLRFNGFSTSTGGSGASSSHWDGMVGDLGYLNASNDATVSTWLSTPNYPPGAQSANTVWNNNADFDYDRQVLFNNALYKYGFSKYKRTNNNTTVVMLSENFVRTINGTDETKLLPHTKHYRVLPKNGNSGVFHYHHLHVQGLDISFFEIV